MRIVQISPIKLLGLISVAMIFQVPSSVASEASHDKKHINVWHTFVVNSPEEEILARAIESFEMANPDIEVEATRIPYHQNLQQFINSSQGGEAPDVIRLSDTELAKIGHITVEGLPVLEDLRPHLTPNQRKRFESRSVAAMRYGDPLYAIPTSQGSLSLLYNKALFDAAGLEYPRDDWTTEEFLQAAKALTDGEVMGLSVPLIWSYWFIPFMTGFGGSLFDEHDDAVFASQESATAVDWFLDLERKHHVVAPGTRLESMSTLFATKNAAMVFDGSWSVGSYLDADIDLGQAVMPLVSETGKRMVPLLSYFGWAISKQSDAKVASVKLALWLTSTEVQKEFALETYMVPTDTSLTLDTDIAADPLLAGFLRQTAHGTTVPTTKAANLVFEQLDTALEMTYTGVMDAGEALEAADKTLEEILRQ
jgi:multiple sugar transport system substrate-binding protein